MLASIWTPANAGATAIVASEISVTTALQSRRIAPQLPDARRRRQTSTRRRARLTRVARLPSVRAVQLVLAVTLGLAGAALAGPPPGTPASQKAIELCEQAGRVPDGEQLAQYEAALAAAEAAVALDERDALAHFAVFCALGGRMRRQGLGPGALIGLLRLRREVDRTIELAPDFADGHAGKGALLLDSPRVLGGDPAAAEALFRHALALEPDYLGPRLDLARALLRRDAKDEARREARRALRIARRRDDAKSIERARALLAEIDPAANGGG